MALGFYQLPIGDMIASVSRGMYPPEGYKGWLRCSWCNLTAPPEKPLLHCARCKKSKTPVPSLYCNQKCQKAHWPIHKYLCGIRVPVQPQEIVLDPPSSADFKLLQRWHTFYHVVLSWATLQAFRTAPEMDPDQVFLQINLMPDPHQPNVKRKPRIIIESFHFTNKSKCPSGRQFACFRGEDNPGEHLISSHTRPKPKCCYAIKYESIMAFGRPLFEDMTSSPDLFMIEHMLQHEPCPQWPWVVADLVARGLQASEATATYLAIQAVGISVLKVRPGNLLEAWQTPAISEPFEPSRIEDWKKLLAKFNSSNEKDQKKTTAVSPPCDCDEHLEKWRRRWY